ncbi:hypothetical protein [Rhizobium azibense]|uniref:Uncharacterized protein n=1 Tax=Rhizobium azibense TaxID=1136135 RepID=A0A4R3REZ0_9HYPH|nr:hypothetical protein [Rhizobium azibense]TCU34110.1 hypothetical protein EV129_11393 [Rhizobium azibense]
MTTVLAAKLSILIAVWTSYESLVAFGTNEFRPLFKTTLLKPFLVPSLLLESLLTRGRAEFLSYTRNRIVAL